MGQQAVNNIERRIMPVSIKKKDDDSESRRIVGYAAVFNSASETLWGSFIEEVDSAAFDEADMSDVRALFNHDANKILARTPRTLSVEIDNAGLRYKFDMPDTTAGNDLLESMRRGDVTQSSFGFTVIEDEWIDRSADGLLPLRRILKVGQVFDVSPVTYAAYPETTSEVRSRFGIRTIQEGGIVTPPTLTNSVDGNEVFVPINLNNEIRTDKIDALVDAYDAMLTTYKGLALRV